MAAGKYRDWSPILTAFVAGEPAAVVELTTVVLGLLARMRAFEWQSSWEDLCHEVLTAFLLSLRQGRLDQPEASVSYLETITRRKLADWIRAQRRSPGVNGERVLATAVVDSVSPERRSTGAPPPHHPDVLIDLARCMEALPERERDVIHEVCLEGKSYQEAADALGLPLGTLKTLRSQAIRTLRERLGVRV